MTAEPRVLLVHGLWSSERTWWRVGPALEARGWDVDTVALAGHGGRPLGTARSLVALADDVLAQRPGGRTVVVGHSLGAVVALLLAARSPSYAAGVLLEDPPGRGRVRPPADGVDPGLVEARTDPDAAIGSLLVGHPSWRRRDARSVVEGLLLTDPALATLSPRDLTWDLLDLVRACPVPVGLVACKGRYSALAELDRSALVRMLPPGHVTEVPGSHHVHLDAPATWIEAVDAFGRSLS